MKMITIDGSQKSGSGTILRYAVSLAALLGKSLHIKNIRAKRKKPGLQPQHLCSVRAVKELVGAEVKGLELGSSEIIFTPPQRYVGAGFKPRRHIRGGTFSWDIGTAGSTTMLGLSVLPLAIFAPGPSTFKITGGLFQDFAPSAHHMQYVLVPTLKRMGVTMRVSVIRSGYYPKGGGVISFEVHPVDGKLKPITMLEQGKVTEIRGIALSSHLENRKVSSRMAISCRRILRGAGYEPKIELVNDKKAFQAGAALAVWAMTSTGCIIGNDMAGKLGRRAEDIGRMVAENLLADLMSGATIDRFLADQIILYTALAEGLTTYIIPRITEHIETNLWLVEEILGASVKLKGNRIEVNGIGFELYRGSGLHI